MHDDRIIDLAEDIRNHVFEILDSEPGMNGDECGKVARAVEIAFMNSMYEIKDLLPPD